MFCKGVSPSAMRPLEARHRPMTVRKRGGLAGAVAAEQHGRAGGGRVEIDALQDVIAADMGVHALQGQGRAHAAASGLTPR